MNYIAAQKLLSSNIETHPGPSSTKLVSKIQMIEYYKLLTCIIFQEKQFVQNVLFENIINTFICVS